MTTTTNPRVQDMIDHVTSECRAIDREQRFRDMLDEVYSFEAVGGPFAHMSPAKVLEEMDPIAFRCGVNDYMDSEGTYEIEGETYDREDVEKAAEEFIDELRSDLSDLETDLEDGDNEDGDANELKEQIAAAEEAIKACERHQW